MWTPIKLTDKATGKSIHITIFEREMYFSGEWSDEDLWEIWQGEQEELKAVAQS